MYICFYLFIAMGEWGIISCRGALLGCLVYHFTYFFFLRLRRPLDHVIGFFLTELGTCGTLEERQRLVVKGRVARETYKGILIRYTSKHLIMI